jgi:elongation factor G
VRTQHLYVPKGKDLDEVKELRSGMIGAITKADAVAPATRSRRPGIDVVLSAIRFPSPVWRWRCSRRSAATRTSWATRSRKLLDADPTLQLVRDADTTRPCSGAWGTSTSRSPPPC